MLRAETPQEQFNLIGAGRRNLLINGGFDVWQRGTSFSANQYTADRVYSQADGSTQTFERVQDAVGVYHLKATRTSASALYNNIVFSVENGINIASDKFVTFSFWAKASVPVEVEVNFRRSSNGYGGTSLVNDGVSDASTDHYVSTGWTYVSQTVKLRNTFQATDVHLLAQIGISNLPLNAYLELKEVQLELGKVATPFEHRSYGEELALCKRYYERVAPPSGSNYQSLALGKAYSTTQWFAFLPFEVEKRATPSVSYDTGSNFGFLDSANATIQVTSISTSRITTHAVSTIGTVSTGLSQGHAGALNAYSTAKPFIAIDAEL
jgi:hypothetical protein